MLLNRHRIVRLIELVELARTVQGPERARREEEVALLVKAAYDDATEAARAAFMARVQTLPPTTWPWSAVDTTAPRAAAARGGIHAIAGRPHVNVPAVLLLIRGQAESADIEPGDRLPDRGTPEGASWEPLYRALDAWDTRTISAWIGPQGWFNPSVGSIPATPSDGSPSGGIDPPQGADVPVEPMPSAPSLTWRRPGVIVAGATVASTLGIVLFSLRGRRAANAAVQETP